MQIQACDFLPPNILNCNIFKSKMSDPLTWKLISNDIKFIYEDDSNSDPELDPHSKNSSSYKNSIDQNHRVSQQFIKDQEDIQLLEITIQKNVLVDAVTSTCIFIQKQTLPKITVSLLETSNILKEPLQDSMHLELYLCTKSKNPDSQSFIINKRGVTGETRIRCKGPSIVFDKISINCSSNSVANFLIVLQQVNNEHVINYKSMMISSSINIIKQNFLISIDCIKFVKRFFKDPQIDDEVTERSNEQKTCLIAAELDEEIRVLEGYLTGKNRKSYNLIYLLNKYPHILELYFLAGSKDFDPQTRFNQLSKRILQIKSEDQKIDDDSRTCNYVHPQAIFVLKINSSFLRIRIIIKKYLTRFLSIIASNQQFDCRSGKWIKFAAKFPQIDELHDRNTPPKKLKKRNDQNCMIHRAPKKNTDDDSQYDEKLSQQDSAQEDDSSESEISNYILIDREKKVGWENEKIKEISVRKKDNLTKCQRPSQKYKKGQESSSRQKVKHAKEKLVKRDSQTKYSLSQNYCSQSLKIKVSSSLNYRKHNQDQNHPQKKEMEDISVNMPEKTDQSNQGIGMTTWTVPKLLLQKMPLQSIYQPVISSTTPISFPQNVKFFIPIQVQNQMMLYPFNQSSMNTIGISSNPYYQADQNSSQNMILGGGFTTGGMGGFTGGMGGFTTGGMGGFITGGMGGFTGGMGGFTTGGMEGFTGAMEGFTVGMGGLTTGGMGGFTTGGMGGFTTGGKEGLTERMGEFTEGVREFTTGGTGEYFKNKESQKQMQKEAVRERVDKEKIEERIIVENEEKEQKNQEEGRSRNEQNKS